MIASQEEDINEKSEKILVSYRNWSAFNAGMYVCFAGKFV